ncbi:MAG: DNA repair protein [Clostridiales bacterium]|nr:DNA repair protein [Candidatus Crickella equi]
MEDRNVRQGHIRKEDRVYMCIDLKSFYASVECVERGLDPMTAELVVADPTRTDKTICLAVSPALKKLGVGGRARVFEIPEHLRKRMIMAPPRMQLYIDYAAEIYGVYLDYVSPEDMYVYSIDEVFLDVTHYLRRYGFTPREMATFLMNEVTERVGVRATAGIGTNMYLAKIALDVTAKHSPDFIGYLDEASFINTLWDHKPLTDFWRIGPGTAKRLAKIGIFTMRDIARADENVLYDMFGIDAELMIDHAWGIEPTKISDIKGFKNKSHSLSRGQVLMRDYNYEEGELIVKEMTEQLCLEMTDIKKVTKNVSIAVGYSNALHLPMARGSVSFNVPTDALGMIMPGVVDVYRRVVSPLYPVRRVFINFNDIHDADEDQQMTLFDLDDADKTDAYSLSREEMERDSALQEAVNKIKYKYGKDSMFRGMDMTEAATTRERNHQIGGHKE